jgi:predicted dinucleotide-binding enzyme
MTSVTIFGTGNMGTAIGDVLTAGGASVQYVTRSDDATIRGNIVVLGREPRTLRSYLEELAAEPRTAS